MSTRESQAHNFWPARIAAAVLLLIVLGSMAFAEFQTQQNSRKDIEDRFAVRATTASSFLVSYVSYTLDREQELAKMRLGDPTISHEQFLDYLDDFGFGPSVLLDETGHVVDIAPYKKELIGTQLSSKYSHLNDAVKGNQGVSNVVPSAVQKFPIVAFATPFESQVGTRVISGAYDLTTKPLGNYLKNALPYSHSAVYLVDADENVIASSSEQSGTLKSIEPNLASINKSIARGTYKSKNGDESYFVTEKIKGTPWRIIVAVNKDTLFKPIDGTNRILPWLFFLCFAILLIVLVTRLVLGRERRIRLQDVALIDLLTGIYNPRGLKNQLTRLLSGSRRHENDLSVFIVDIDDFKKFNDIHGSNVGDEMLVLVSEEIQKRLRTEDIVGRWGGEEFVVLLPDTNTAGAKIVAERICRGVEEDVRSLTEVDAHLTISIGIASIEPDDTVDSIITRANDALVNAKAAGKNQVSSEKVAAH